MSLVNKLFTVLVLGIIVVIVYGCYETNAQANQQKLINAQATMISNSSQVMIANSQAIGKLADANKSAVEAMSKAMDNQQKQIDKKDGQISWLDWLGIGLVVIIVILLIRRGA